MEAGAWWWYRADAVDAVGNAARPDSAAAAAAGWPTTITVQSASPAPPIFPVGSTPQAAPANSLPASIRQRPE